MRRGPQADFVRDRDGNVVNGLRIQRARKGKDNEFERYFSIWQDGQKERRRYHGSSDDRPTAILRFRQWEAQQAGDTVAIRRRRLRQSDVDGGIEAALKQPVLEVSIDEHGDIEVEELLASDAFWDTVRDLIRSFPELAAQRTGIEQLAYLHRLEPPPPSKPLEEIIALYLDDKKADLTPKEWKNSRTWWDEFTEITGAKFVVDLDRDAIRNYRSVIKQRQSTRKRSASWVRSRFGKIKSVVNHALSGEMALTAAERSMLELRSLLKQPSKPTPNPVDITREEFRAILKQADDWQTALLLVALNCAYYPIDCRRLTWSMIDFKRSTIRFDRTKATGRARGAVPRVAVLWKRTITALTKLQHGQEHVFVSTYGRPVHIETIRRHWQALLKKARIRRGLTFANLRDSALTVAAESTSPVVPTQQYHVLAGHVAKGVDDNYIRRNPRMVELACQAIEQYYFGR
jgi:integrase